MTYGPDFLHGHPFIWQDHGHIDFRSLSDLRSWPEWSTWPVKQDLFFQKWQKKKKEVFVAWFLDSLIRLNQAFCSRSSESSILRELIWNKRFAHTYWNQLFLYTYLNQTFFVHSYFCLFLINLNVSSDQYNKILLTISNLHFPNIFQ